MFQKLRKITKSERGAAAVEFALLLPVIATLTFGMIDFGRMLWFQEVLVNATRTGARQGTLFNSGNGQAQIQGFVAQSLTNGGVPTAGLNVTVNGIGTGQGNPLTVTSSILMAGLPAVPRLVSTRSLVAVLPETTPPNATSAGETRSSADGRPEAAVKAPITIRPIREN